MKQQLIKFIFLLFVSFSISGSLKASDPVVDGEHFVLHLNKSFFVTGETVWYSLYIPNTLKGTAFSVEAQVTTGVGVIKDNYFLKTEGKKQLDGYFKIPFDWTTGYYTLTFSGIDDATKERIKLAKVDIPIYNDLEKLPKGLQIQEIKNSKSNKIKGSKGSLDIQLDKTSYAKGETVNANVVVKDASGKAVKSTVSVSVLDHKLGGDHLLNQGSVHTFYDYKTPTVKLSNDLYTFGKITKEDNSPLTASIIGAYSPLENKVHYLKSDAAGKYALKLPEFYGEKPLQLLLYKSMDKFNVNEESRIPVPKNLKPQSVVYTEEVLEYIKQSLSRKKVYQFYGGVENDLQTTSVPVERAKLKPGLTYKMDEYESFDNVGEFFIEVTTPLRFKINKDNTFSGAIVNPRQYTSATKTLNGDPLFIIDGKVTKNADFVAKMKLTEVDEVKLYYNPNKLNDFYRAISLGGVAEISTKVDDFHIPQEDEEDIFIAKGVQTIGTFAEDAQDGNLPSFKSQIYWNPQIETNNKGNAKVSYTQSDDVSIFIIKVVAQTATGDMIYGEKTYEVKRMK